MPEQVTAGFELSPQQKHLCGLHERAARSIAGMAISVKGAVDAKRLHDALREVVERHEILRTTFQRRSGMKFPFQVVNAATDVAWDVADLRGLNATEQDARVQRLLDGEAEIEATPVVRAALLTLENDQHVLEVRMPALCADHLTLNNLVSEVMRFYSGEQAGEATPLQYADYSEWQNELLQKNDEESQAARRFWNRHDFAAIPPVRLPFEQKPDARAGVEVEAVPVDLAGEVWDRVETASGGDTESFLLACWQTLLWKMTGQPEIVIGYVSDGRSHEELGGGMGRFAKTLPLHANFEQELSIGQRAREMRVQRDAAIENQDYAPVFDESLAAGFRVEKAFDAAGTIACSLVRERCAGEGFHIELRCLENGESKKSALVYDPVRFERSVVEKLAGRFAILLAAAVADPNARASALPILDVDERRLVTFEFNRTSAEFARDKCIHYLFEQSAARRPDNPALRYGDREFTYAELNARANQIAHYLRNRGVKANTAVGLCVERSAEMIVGLLGILKAGGCYVPLVPDNPKSRLTHQLSETQAPVVITEAKLLDRLPKSSGEVLCLDGDGAKLDAESTKDPSHINGPDDLVYVIYTSGSTGVPKGVAVRHRNLVNYSQFICRRLESEKYPDGLHFATVSTISADLGNTCIFPALISGGCLHVIGYETAMAPNLYADYAGKHPIDVLKITPSHLGTLLNSPDGKSVLPRKYLVLGGEAFSWHLLNRIAQMSGCGILNHYGPTEATVGCCTFLARRPGVGELAIDSVRRWSATVPIGKPIDNDEVYIVDSSMEPAPIGVAGELCIGGAGIARGYLNQPQQTAERFVANPFSSDPDARMYRTGDLARFLPDGNVEFLGRIDHQVKIRGFRVEPAEIEAVLKKHPAVKQSVIVPYEDKSGERRLAAYIVSANKPRTEELRTFLMEQLPEYMVPSAFVVMESLPLTANGKVNLKELPDPEAAQGPQEREFVAARNSEEEKLVAIWREVLKLDQVSVTDNFFELGGHSLLATQIISRIRNAFRVQMPLHSFLAAPTIVGLAERIAQCPPAESEEEEMARLLAELDGISDEEAARLLAAEEEKNGRG